MHVGSLKPNEHFRAARPGGCGRSIGALAKPALAGPSSHRPSPVPAAYAQANGTGR